MNNNRCNLKYLHHEPYMNPNNFDITFEPEDVPSNIVMESAYELEKRLQKLMPLTKIIHVNLGNTPMGTQDNVNVFGMLRVNGKEVKFI